MAMAASEIDIDDDVAVLEIKSSPDVSMDGSQQEHSQALDSCDADTPEMTMETSTRLFSTASLNIDIKDESDSDLEEPVKIDENSLPSNIQEICPVDKPCIKCEIEQPCSFRFTHNGEILYLCNEPCVKAYQAEHPGKYTVSLKKYTIEEITPKTLLCSECGQKKTCYFYYNFDDTYYCSLDCLEGMMADEKDKYTINLNNVTICIDQIRPKEGQCLICEKVKPCEFLLVRYGEPRFLCERTCINILSGREHGRYYIKKLRVSKPAVSNAIDKNLAKGYQIQAKAAAMVQREQSFRRRCSQCTLILMIDENVLTWEAMDFCDERCLERFQNGIGSRCAKCNTLVQHTSLGKYCVRFGYDIRQFCNSSCLDEFKKGLKICYYCQRDISASMQVFLVPVGDERQYKNFCAQSCVEKFDERSKNAEPEPVWAKCAVCSLEKATAIEMEVTETASQQICSDPCFAAYKFVNNIIPDQCKLCKKYFVRTPTRSFTTYDDSNPNCFCSLSCMTIHIHHTRLLVPCDRCNSMKYNFDMIRRMDNDQPVMMCSLHCLSLYHESANARSSSKDPGPSTSQPLPTTQPLLKAGPSSTGLPIKTHSIAEQLMKVRTTMAADKKKLNSLTVEQKSTYLALREQKQVTRSLLPDAPERKQKRKPSPTRIVCPLLPGVPLTAPPRKLQPWEIRIEERDLLERRRCDLAALSTSRPSRVSVDDVELSDINDSVPPAPETPLRKKQKLPLMLLPSTGILRAETLENVEIVDVQIELVGFTPESSVSNVHHSNHSSPALHPESSGKVANTNIFDENEELQWDEATGFNPGSDIEEEVLESEGIDISYNRNITCTVNDLPSEMMDLLSEMDQRDDRALRDIASDPDMLYFNWSSDTDTFTGQQEVFTGEAGPTFSLDGLTPIKIFEKIWDDSIMNLIVQETNRYGHQLSMRVHKTWTDINVTDIWTFFGIIMLQSLLPLPVEKEYWYPCLPYLKLGNFSQIMSYKKFISIKKCLHFVDNMTIDTGDTVNKKLQKIWPIIQHLNGKFCSMYQPEQHIAIDESLLLWKGRLSFAQLIATKAARVGIKSYELCESRTGYLWKMLIYTGKEPNKPEQDAGAASIDEPTGATSRIVYDLVRPLLNRGHTLVMDNFYNSPLLSRTLKSKKTDTMGTLRLNRQFVPDTLKKKTKSNTRVGEILFSQTEDLSICLWHDANMVSMISTYHKAAVGGIEKHGTYKYKPQVVLDYNLSMGGVDKKDQMLQAFPVERIRNQVWYKKLFRRLLNVSIYNAFVIYGHQNKTVCQRQFRVTLADEIIKKMLYSVPNPCEKIQPRMGHYPVRNKTGNSRCKWCSKRKVVSRTVWKCDACNVNLCILGCFRNYHNAL